MNKRIFDKPGQLMVPEPEYFEISNHHYSVAPILGMLAINNARSYAESMLNIVTSDISQSSWINKLIPEDKVSEKVKEVYAANKQKLLNNYQNRLAKSIDFAKYVLTIGIFDNQTADPHHPDNLVGFIETSLRTEYKKAKDWYVRSSVPEKVYPSIDGGLYLRPDFAVLDNSGDITEKTIEFALKTFNKDDVGVKYRNSLDFETSHENILAIDGFRVYGNCVVSDFNEPMQSLFGEHPTRLQLSDLKSIL